MGSKEDDVGVYEKYLEEAKYSFDQKWKEFDDPRPVAKTTDINHYDSGKSLGEGAFGKVFLVKSKDKGGGVYAMKMVEKRMTVKRKQITNLLNEKRVLQSVKFPFLLSLVDSFQDNCSLFLVMPVIPGGELYGILNKFKKFEEGQARFYCAQVLMAFEYLHYLGIVYRDLKPENLLLDCDGYLKLTDFGFAKKVSERTYTFCGTPQYIAPEIIQNKGYAHAVDWWSFGILVYELNAGYPPFDHNDHVKIYELTVSGKYSFPKFFSDAVMDAVSHLLQTDISRRYGNLKNGVQDIKDLKWFSSINWKALYKKQMKSPFVPSCKKLDDPNNFKKKAPIPICDRDEFGHHFPNF